MWLKAGEVDFTRTIGRLRFTRSLSFVFTGMQRRNEIKILLHVWHPELALGRSVTHRERCCA
jgi:hypothetical protein